MLAAEIDAVLRTNLSLRQILGEEYINPIPTIVRAIIMLGRLNVIIARSMPIALVIITNKRACAFVTRPDDIGRFFPLDLSRSASTRSFRTYIPVMIKKVAASNGRN
jgi:hypothetical protein